VIRWNINDEMDLIDKIDFTTKYLRDPRLRRDLKILKIARKGYAFYGWELLEKMQVSEMLKRPISVNEIMKEKGVKNGVMLETLLDFLVGCGTLSFDTRYQFKGKKPEFSDLEYNFIRKHTPGSADWTHFLCDHAEETLMEGHPPKITGFTDDKFLDLWDSLMEGPLHSLRLLAMEKLISKLKEGMIIADLGSGSGIALVEILSTCKKRINLFGFDSSVGMIERSRRRIEKFKEEHKTPIDRENARNVQLILHDLTDDFPDENKGKFDLVFLSFVVNHIPPEKRDGFFKNISSILKKDGWLVMAQLINQSKFDRNFSDWLLWVTPTHQGFPFRDEYLAMLARNFSEVKDYLHGNIIVARK